MTITRQFMTLISIQMTLQLFMLFFTNSPHLHQFKTIYDRILTTVFVITSTATSQHMINLPSPKNDKVLFCHCSPPKSYQTARVGLWQTLGSWSDKKWPFWWFLLVDCTPGSAQLWLFVNSNHCYHEFCINVDMLVQLLPRAMMDAIMMAMVLYCWGIFPLSWLQYANEKSIVLLLYKEIIYW